MDSLEVEVASLRLPVPLGVFPPPLFKLCSSLSVCTSLEIKSELSDIFYPFSLPYISVWLLFKSFPTVYVHLLFCSHCLLIFPIFEGVLCILPKYSQKALADFPPDNPLFVPCHSERWEGSRVFSPYCCRNCKEEQHLCGIWGCGSVLCYWSGKVYPSPWDFHPIAGKCWNQSEAWAPKDFVNLETKCDKINIVRGAEMHMRRKCREI